MYLIYEKGTVRELENLTAVRQAAHTYDLWIDLEAGVVREATKGNIDLASKLILGRLLLFLMTNAGRPYPPDELYEAVWDREVFGLSEGNTVRTSISRLRNLIEPAPPEWRYIKKTATTFWCPVGAYFFDSEASYCLVTRRTFTLPRL